MGSMRRSIRIPLRRRQAGHRSRPNLAALDRFVPHPVYAKQRWISILNPSHESVEGTLMTLIAAGHERLAAREGRDKD